MTRWRQINAVSAAATALLVIVTGCAATPAAEQSASAIPTSSVPAATAPDRGEPAAPTATPSPSSSSVAPSMAPPSTAPPDPNPTPATTPPPVTSGQLRVDGLALVIVDRLRVRSAPGTGADSERLEPLLRTGTMLFVIEGPVAGSGYDWYRVAPATFGNGGDQGEFRYWGDAGPIGWVANADRDGTPWIIGAMAECPDLAASNADLSVVERLGPLVALSCWGDATVQFRAKLSSRTFVDGFGGDVGPDPMYPGTYWATPLSVEVGASFGTVVDPAMFPYGDADIQRSPVWIVVGHFDDEAATACGTFRKLDDRSAAGWILTCRTTFVVTDLVPTDAS